MTDFEQFVIIDDDTTLDCIAAAIATLDGKIAATYANANGETVRDVADEYFDILSELDALGAQRTSIIKGQTA